MDYKNYSFEDTGLPDRPLIRAAFEFGLAHAKQLLHTPESSSFLAPEFHDALTRKSVKLFQAGPVRAARLAEVCSENPSDELLALTLMKDAIEELIEFRDSLGDESWFKTVRGERMLEKFNTMLDEVMNKGGEEFQKNVRELIAYARGEYDNRIEDVDIDIRLDRRLLLQPDSRLAFDLESDIDIDPINEMPSPDYVTAKFALDAAELHEAGRLDPHSPYGTMPLDREELLAMAEEFMAMYDDVEPKLAQCYAANFNKTCVLYGYNMRLTATEDGEFTFRNGPDRDDRYTFYKPPNIGPW